MLLENGNDVNLASLINQEARIRDLNGVVVQMPIVARQDECITCDIMGNKIDVPLDAKTAIYTNEEEDGEELKCLRVIEIKKLYSDYLDLKANSVHTPAFPEVANVEGGTVRLRLLDRGEKVFFWPAKTVSFSHFGVPFYC